MWRANLALPWLPRVAKEDAETRPAAQAITGLYAATVGLDDRPADGQSEPVTWLPCLPSRSSAEEGLKDARAIVGRNTRPFVLDSELHFAAVREPN
jgi:hypothetical protein